MKRTNKIFLVGNTNWSVAPFVPETTAVDSPMYKCNKIIWAALNKEIFNVVTTMHKEKDCVSLIVKSEYVDGIMKDFEEWHGVDYFLTYMPTMKNLHRLSEDNGMDFEEKYSMINCFSLNLAPSPSLPFIENNRIMFYNSRSEKFFELVTCLVKDENSRLYMTWVWAGEDTTVSDIKRHILLESDVIKSIADIKLADVNVYTHDDLNKEFCQGKYKKKFGNFDKDKPERWLLNYTAQCRMKDG